MQQENDAVAELAQSTLEANKEHLAALKLYTQRLEVELETFDKLLDTVDTVDGSDLDMGCFVTIPGSVRATAPIARRELLSPESPFYQDALKRSRYQSFSQVHPMKAKELDSLAEAVQAESRRKHALEIQKSGYPGFSNVDAQMTHMPELNAESIDWARVAEKVSALSLTTRTAIECEVRWLGEQRPEFNREPWSQEEVLKVKSLAAESVDGQPDWVVIAERLGTRRTPLDCMRHAIPRKSHQWSTETDERLRRAIRMYGHDNWHLVACYVSEDATPSQCSHRYRVLDESIKRTSWSAEEDARLSVAVAAYGSSWVDVATNLSGRYSDQCRERWTEQLNPSINKSQWSAEEDRLLLDYVREHKDASWKEVSERLRNGRTQAMCRNRYTVLQRGANSGPAVPVIKSSFSNQSSCPATPAPHQTKQLVFLEPVVSSNPESHKHHGRRSSQHRMRPRATTAAGNALASNATTMLPSKKRKAQSYSARSNGPSAEAQQDPTLTQRDMD